MEENCEKRWKIWKTNRLNSEMIWNIRKKNRLNSEMIWNIQKKIVERCRKYGTKVS
jgi:hypothetical protein